MVKFELEEYHRNVTKEELIADLKFISSKEGEEAITGEEYKKRGGKFHPCTFVRKFGSWLKALEIAGLNKTRNYGTTKEEYFRNLEEVWVKLGRQPRYKDMRMPLSKNSGRGYWHKFGSWRKALEEFIEYINKEEVFYSDRTREAPLDISILPRLKSKEHRTKREISWRLRFIVMRRDNFKCKSCGRSPATDPKIILHVDHVIPYASGGEGILENLQTLCSICNIGKSNLAT